MILTHTQAETFFKNTLEHIVRGCILRVCIAQINFDGKVACYWNDNELEAFIEYNKDSAYVEIDEKGVIDKIHSDFQSKTGQNLSDYNIKVRVFC